MEMTLVSLSEGESGLSQDKGYNFLVGKKLYFVELLGFEEV